MSTQPTCLSGLIAVLALLAFQSAPGNAQQLDGERLFRQRCAACHAIQPGQNRVGPTLFAVLGRAAGSVAGARYSEAMRRSDVAWDEQALDKFLANPLRHTPGTTMSVAVQNPNERKALIDFLATLR
ncbi:c-type cytochrome [Bordetella sp. BOR01]|uniref:c-type cytochrome n=1 Tax=Bordetella sp. BOR01 TaxID=2854779 RepID=UPI001C457D43|nr:c-type cytochrome [Bordetella sp. BOR01]